MAVRPLAYDADLTIDEARERLEEVRGEFDAVRTKYTKGLRRYQWWMSEKDEKMLTECFGVLLPLGIQKSVQEELGAAENPEDTVNRKSISLGFKILDMMADYNKGVERVGYSEPTWRND